MDSGELVEWLREKDVLSDSPPKFPQERMRPDEQAFELDEESLFAPREEGTTFEADLPRPLRELQHDLGDIIGKRPPPGKGPLPPPDGDDPKPRGTWDICAWYQPIHYFGDDWGIFIRSKCILQFAREIAAFLPPSLASGVSASLTRDLAQSAFHVLFLHEHFHHKVESLAIRLFLVERMPRYVPYKDQVYRPSYLTISNLEEALANADAFLRLSEAPYSRLVSRDVRQATKDYLGWRFPLDPPGYSEAVRYLTRPAFRLGLEQLHSQVQEASLTPMRGPGDWRFSFFHRSLFSVASNIWEVVPGGTSPILPGASPYTSIGTDSLVKIAERHGYTMKAGGKGSHIRLDKPGSVPLTIPANRRDVSPGVLKTTLRAIDGYKLRDIDRLLQAL